MTARTVTLQRASRPNTVTGVGYTCRMALADWEALGRPETIIAALYDETESQGYRLWVSEDRCTFVRHWTSGKVEVAHRETPEHTWGPPVSLTEERIP